MSAAARPRALGALVLLIGVLVLLALLPAQTASARDRGANPVGSDRFTGGRYYRGDFPDPAVLKVGRTYFAYSTTMSSLNLPVMVSTNLASWRAVGEGPAEPGRLGAAAAGRQSPRGHHVGTERDPRRAHLRARLRHPGPGREPAQDVHLGVPLVAAGFGVRRPHAAPAGLPDHPRRDRPAVLPLAERRPLPALEERADQRLQGPALDHPGLRPTAPGWPGRTTCCSPRRGPGSAGSSRTPR